MSELVLVTGGAGFIGSHTCEALLAAGYRVRVLDDLSTGRAEWVPAAAAAAFRRGDIRDATTCVMACQGVDYVIHLAAMSRSGPSMDQIKWCTERNVVGTLDMLDAAHRAGVKKFIYAGSATWYGNWPNVYSDNPGLHEKAPSDFMNPYALTKGVGEMYALAFDRFYGLPTRVLRFFSVYGPRQPTEGPEALVIGKFLSLTKRGEAVQIYGDGSQRRDFVHVVDVARALVRSIQADGHGDIINIGSGTSTSIYDLAVMLDARWGYLPARSGDAQETLADIRTAEKVLGWRPTIPLEYGLETALKEEQ